MMVMTIEEVGDLKMITDLKILTNKGRPDLPWPDGDMPKAYIVSSIE